MQDVILAHGLWVPGAVLQPLAARLERAGFRCHTFSYPGTARPLDVHAERLARMAQESLEKQRGVEAADKLPFETYRQQYLSHAK